MSEYESGFVFSATGYLNRLTKAPPEEYPFLGPRKRKGYFVFQDAHALDSDC